MKMKAKGVSSIRGHLAVMLSRCSDPIDLVHAYVLLANQLRLDREELAERYANHENDWHALVRAAYKQLKALGYAPASRETNRGQLSLTAAGRSYAKRIESCKAEAFARRNLGL